MATKLGTLKQGDTLAFYINLADGETPITGAASNLRSQVRNSGGVLLSELTITESEDTAGRYDFIADTDTQSWTGTVSLDIEYSVGEIKKSSETLTITMEKDVTRDE